MKRWLLGAVLVLAPLIVAGCTAEHSYDHGRGMHEGERNVNTDTPAAERAYPQEEPW